MVYKGFVTFSLALETANTAIRVNLLTNNLARMAEAPQIIVDLVEVAEMIVAVGVVVEVGVLNGIIKVKINIDSKLC